MTDITIIGAGISGMLSAWYLSEAGASVRIFDKQEPGRESSWAGGGIISPLHPWRYPDPVNHLAAWSQTQFPALVEQLHHASGTDPEYIPSGLLIPWVCEAEVADAQAWAARFDADLLLLSPTEMDGIQPGVNARDGFHLYLPKVAQVRNPRFLQALKGALQAKGVEFHCGEEVVDLLVEDGQVRGLRTASKSHHADTVVVCAGAWTSQLLPQARIYPIRGQMLLFQASPDLLKPIVLAADTYLIPRKDGKIVAGSTMEDVGFDKTPTDSARNDIYRRALQVLPALADCPVIHHWAGLRPGCDSGVPTIGPVPGVKGLFVNAGQFRNGVVMGPASARLLADLVIGREPIVGPGAYHL